VTWFADAPLGGGPADGFLKVHLVVVPEGASLDAGLVPDSGRPNKSKPGSDAGTGGGGGSGDNGSIDATGGTSGQGGCSLAPGGRASSFALASVFGFFALSAFRRRRRA
jgi:hypothetical protein